MNTLAIPGEIHAGLGTQRSTPFTLPLNTLNYLHSFFPDPTKGVLIGPRIVEDFKQIEVNSLDSGIPFVMAVESSATKVIADAFKLAGHSKASTSLLLDDYPSGWIMHFRETKEYHQAVSFQNDAAKRLVHLGIGTFHGQRECMLDVGWPSSRSGLFLMTYLRPHLTNLAYRLDLTWKQVDRALGRDFGGQVEGRAREMKSLILDTQYAEERTRIRDSLKLEADHDRVTRIVRPAEGVANPNLEGPILIITSTARHGGEVFVRMRPTERNVATWPLHPELMDRLWAPILNEITG
jgi:hypothetical protein